MVFNCWLRLSRIVLRLNQAILGLEMLSQSHILLTEEKNTG